MPIQINTSVKGKEYPPYAVTVERGKIKEFARAIGDLSPLYLDDTVAKAGPWGDIIAPPKPSSTPRATIAAASPAPKKTSACSPTNQLSASPSNGRPSA